jgi:hypothetical protein
MPSVVKKRGGNPPVDTGVFAQKCLRRLAHLCPRVVPASSQSQVYPPWSGRRREHGAHPAASTINCSQLDYESTESTPRFAKLPVQHGEDHYRQFVEACRGNGKTSTPFSYSGPLTESVLLGCLATRFPKTTLEWDPANLKVSNSKDASTLVRRRYRKGWEVDGL